MSSPLRVLLVSPAPATHEIDHLTRDLIATLDPAQVTARAITDLPGSTPLAAWRLARLAREAQAQVIQTFTLRAHLISAWVALFTRVPSVWRLGDTALSAVAARTAGLTPRRVITPSRHLRKYYYPLLRVTDLVPDGLPAREALVKKDARQKLNLPAEGLVVAQIGRHAPDAGQAVFVRALAHLAPHYSQLQSVIISEKSAPEITTLLQQLDLTARVTMLNDMTALEQVLAAADVVVHSPTTPDPFARVVIEAMAAGAPVIASQIGSLPEIVAPGLTGVLVPPNNDQALTQALQRLLDNPALRHYMGQAGRTRAAADFSAAYMATRYTEIWGQMALRA